MWGPAVVLAGVAGESSSARFENRAIVVAASLAQAAVLVALTFVDSVPGLLALTALGIGFALSQPAEFALLPAVAGEDGGRRSSRPRWASSRFVVP